VTRRLLAPPGDAPVSATDVGPVVQGLRAISYLAAVPERELRALARRCVVRELPAGGHLFEAGRPARHLFVVLRGRVKVVRSSSGGREQVLHADGAGATLGEVPVLDGGGYVGTAVAVEPTRVLALPRDALLALCRRRPEVARGVIEVLAGRVRAFAGLVEDLALHDLTTRLAAFLAREGRRAGGPEFELSGTRDDVAARLGTVREPVSRALSRLRRAGVIALAGRRVRVLDAARLDLLAGDRD
jgi:CRP/FNR family transcriptional regulator